MKFDRCSELALIDMIYNFTHVWKKAKTHYYESRLDCQVFHLIISNYFYFFVTIIAVCTSIKLDKGKSYH